MTTAEMLDRLTREIYGKPWDELTTEEREHLKARLDSAFGTGGEADDG